MDYDGDWTHSTFDNDMFEVSVNVKHAGVCSAFVIFFGRTLREFY